MGVTYRVIRAWARLLVTSWYRAEIRGAPFPTGVPCIMVMNHTNGLCDGHFQLACTPRPVRVLAKYKLFEIPLLGWIVKNVGAIPVYRKKDGVDTSRNADSFRSIYDALASGDVIAVFPEGESRGTPYLREIKTGAARMALGAEESADWRAGVRIVPVGITYAEIARFRTRAEAWIGESFAVHDSFEAYAHSPILAGRALTLRITEAMRALTLQVPPGEDDGREAAKLACAVERLMPPDTRPLAARRQAAWDGFERLRERDPDGHARRVEAALQLDRNLASHGITAADVLGPEELKPGRLFGELTLRALIGVPLLALCAVIWGMPILLARTIARRGASTPDKVITVTLLTTFGIMVVWLPLFTWFVSSRTGPSMDLLVILVIGLGVATLLRVADNVREMRHLLGRARLAGDTAARTRLAEAMTKLVALVDPAPDSRARSSSPIG